MAVFWTVAMVEGLGVAQIFAFVPVYLHEMGVPRDERLAFVGLFSSLIFVVGAPLVPLWGVWADKYSRKAVIVRSALVEAVVFGLAAIAREPWQLALAMLLIGFQLGNTGVMLAGIRDVTPARRLGVTIAIFGAASPIGFAIGPALGGLIVDGLGLGLSVVFGFSALLSVGTALLVTFGSREIRPEVVPEGPVLALAFGAVRSVLADPVVRRIFAIFGLAFLATQMTRPFVPLLVEGIVGIGPGLASAIALVAGTAALVGALISPVGGAVGDRIGFRPVLVVALIGGSLSLLLMPLVGGLTPLAIVAMVLATCTASVSAMIFSMLASEVAPERRSVTLNLVYLPLYAAGIVGPAVGGVVVTFGGVAAPFLVGSAVFLVGAVTIVLLGRRQVANAGATG